MEGGRVRPLLAPRARANPYILTPLTEGVGFFGRDAVLRFVRNTLSAPFQNVVVLFGQRRIGKTSVLYQLTRPGVTPTGFRAVYFDLQGRAQQPLGQVLFGLAREIARALGLPAPLRADFEEDSHFQYVFLPQVYARLGPQRLLVLVDEFDVLGGEDVPADAAYNTLFDYLQDLLMDEQRHLAFAFVVGRRLDELPSRIKASFKSAQCKRIGVLDREDAEALITEPAAGALRFHPDAVRALVDLTAGHPYFLQLLCYELYDRAQRAGRQEVQAADINPNLLGVAMELGAGGLSWFWDEFPPAERFILSAIAHIAQARGAASLRTIGQTLREHGVKLQGMELATAPTILAEWEIIQSVGRDTYAFRVPFLQRWILSKHTLDEAKRELEQVSARAVRLYERARRLHRQGDLEQALGEYRRALAANPNHSRARLGLAQALFEGGQLVSAAEAFERAYRLDPESARDGLHWVHRDLGALLETEGRLNEARMHYQRVLDISPLDETIRLRLRDLWRATGGAHLADGQPDKALEAYRQALRYSPEDDELMRLLAELEERQVASEVQNRRRQQAERAMLETRLAEAESKAGRHEAESRALLRWMLGGAMTTSLLVALFPLHLKLGDGVYSLGIHGPRQVNMALPVALTVLLALYSMASGRLRRPPD